MVFIQNLSFLMHLYIIRSRLLTPIRSERRKFFGTMSSASLNLQIVTVSAASQTNFQNPDEQLLLCDPNNILDGIKPIRCN